MAVAILFHRSSGASYARRQGASGAGTGRTRACAGGRYAVGVAAAPGGNGTDRGTARFYRTTENKEGP